jgi:hypothetical protein
MSGQPSNKGGTGTKKFEYEKKKAGAKKTAAKKGAKKR